MRILIKKAEIYKEGNYDRLFLQFERDGKTQERKLARVGNNIKSYDVLKGAKPGESYDIKLVKNGQFWDWVDSVAAGESTPGATPNSNGTTTGASGSMSRSVYETPEERNLRQLHIVRQSSIASAVNMLKDTKTGTTTGAVLEAAQAFVDFVYNGLETDAKKHPEFD